MIRLICWKIFPCGEFEGKKRNKIWCRGWLTPIKGSLEWNHVLKKKSCKIESFCTHTLISYWLLQVQNNSPPTCHTGDESEFLPDFDFPHIFTERETTATQHDLLDFLFVLQQLWAPRPPTAAWRRMIEKLFMFSARHSSNSCRCRRNPAASSQRRDKWNSNG